MKQIFLDTETTGLEAERGHRIVEVVALPYYDRRPSEERFHHFCNPRRQMDAEAQKIHGISDEFLLDKPEFAEIAAALRDFLRGAEVIIHNAAFDRAFLDAEFARCEMPPLDDICKVTCSLEMSRAKVPGLRHHRLEDLCRHFGVDASARTTHSAYMDAQLLARMYFAMTREQMPMAMDSRAARKMSLRAAPVISRPASAEEIAAHDAFLDAMEKETGVRPLWRK